MRTPQIKVVHGSDARAIKRTLRKPQHPFNLHTRPFQIAPFLIAPTLPGDTLTNFLMQSRVVSDPVVNPLIGWWKEYYYFHVPITAFGDSRTSGLDPTALRAMFIDPSADARSSIGAAVDFDPYYSFAGGMGWLDFCLTEIVSEFFRDEDGVAQLQLIDNLPGAYIDRRNGFQSLLSDTQVTGDDDELPGVDELEEEVPSPWATEYDKWEILRDAGLTDVSYEDYLRAQGVSVPRAVDVDPATGVAVPRPELLRYVRKWTYPTNHIDPTTGTPSSAVVWNVTERGDKMYAFKEPGFVVGVTVTRPKIYLGSQKGSLTGLLYNYKGWPSMILKDHPETKLIKVTDSATDGPLINQTGDYWLDIGDLYSYGDQFVNYAQSVADNHALDFPADVGGGPSQADRVPTLTQVKSFFVDSAGTKNLIREDGVCHLTFKSRLGRDTTPGGQ